MLQFCRKEYSLLALLIFLQSYFNSTLFFHKHSIGDKYIVHSHLFWGGNSSSPEHSHSSNILDLIASVNKALFFGFNTFELLNNFSVFSSSFLIKLEYKVDLLQLLTPSLRAPPYKSLF